jgi:MFS family permease
MAIYGLGGIAPLFMQSFGAVLTGRFVLGVAEAFILTIASTLLADYFAEEERHKWLAVQGAVAPFLATFMVEGSGHLAAMGWQYPFTVYVLAFPIFLFACKYLWEPPKPTKNPEGEVASSSGSGFPWATILLLMGIGYLGMGLAHDGDAALRWGLVEQLGQGMTVPPLIA